MICPKCGREQAESDECVQCGIVISKFIARQEHALKIAAQRRHFFKIPMPRPEEPTWFKQWERPLKFAVASVFNVAITVFAVYVFRKWNALPNISGLEEATGSIIIFWFFAVLGGKFSKYSILNVFVRAFGAMGIYLLYYLYSV